MKRFLHPFFLLIFLLAISASCRKESVLPDESQSGNGTFGCLVNGKLWLPKSSLNPGGAGIDLSYDPTWNGGTLSLKAQNWSYNSKDQSITTSEYIGLSLGELSQAGQYSLNTEDQQGSCRYSIITENVRDNTVLKGCEYSVSSDQCTGTLTITKLDKVAGIIAGRFEFSINKKAPASTCDSVLTVSEGRFDLRLF